MKTLIHMTLIAAFGMAAIDAGASEPPVLRSKVEDTQSVAPTVGAAVTSAVSGRATTVVGNPVEGPPAAIVRAPHVFSPADPQRKDAKTAVLRGGFGKYSVDAPAAGE